MLNEIEIDSYNFKSEEEAKQRAKEDMRKILFSKFVFTNISSIENEVREKKEKTEKETDIKIQREIKEIEDLKKLMQENEGELESVKQDLSVIDRQYKTSTGNFRVYGDLVDEILNSKRNIDNILFQLDGYINIKDDIDELRQLIQDPHQIINVYKRLKGHSYVRLSLLEKLEQEERVDAVIQVEQHFNCVMKFEEEFFEIIWGYIRKAMKFAIGEPSFLVKILRIIENDHKHAENVSRRFTVSSKLKYKRISYITGENVTGMSPMRNLKKRNVNKGVPLFHRCLKELKKSIKERFDEILSEKEEVEEIMEGSELLLNDLVIVKDRMTPCFPSHYNVFNFYKEIYISKVSEAISPFIPKSSAEAAKDPRILVILASWVDNCQILLEKIGIQDSEDQLILLKSKIKAFIPEFLDYIERLLGDWFHRALNEETQFEKELLKKQKFPSQQCSGFPNDIFTFINSQIDLLSEKLKGENFIEVLKLTFDQLLSIIETIVEDSNKITDSDMYLVVCLRINNLFLCINHYKDTKEKCMSLTPEDKQERLQNILNAKNQNLLFFMSELVDSLCRVTFLDIEKKLILPLFTKTWFESRLVESIFITFEDFFSEYQKYIQEEFYINKVVISFLRMFNEKYKERLILGIQKRKKLKFEYKYSEIPFCSAEYDKKKEKNVVLKKKNGIKLKVDEVVGGLQDDLKSVKEFCNKFEEIIRKNLHNESIGRIELMIKTLKIHREKILSTFGELNRLFGKSGHFLLRTLLTIRKDMDSRTINTLATAFQKQYDRASFIS